MRRFSFHSGAAHFQHELSTMTRQPNTTDKPDATCKHKAVLLITTAVAGTASSLAKRRTELRCGEPDGHSGEHRDPRNNRRWNDRGRPITHVIMHEDEQ